MTLTAPASEVWLGRSREIAASVWQHEVNRTDIWGHYLPNGGSITMPHKHRRGIDRLTVDHLIAHAEGRITIGLHTTSAENACKWNLWDIDAHNDQVDAAENWLTVLNIVDALVKIGVDPLVTDSNGKGGYHVKVLWSEPVPAELAYRFGRHIKGRADAGDIEAFPKQPDIRGGCGNFVRADGRHHKREHWTTYYSVDAERWLTADETVEALIHPPVNDPDILEPLMPILPPIPVAEEVVTVAAGELPVCIQDLLKNNIRHAGDRNKAVLTIARACKAAGLPEADAVAHGVRLTSEIPPALTTANMRREQIVGNVQSVCRSVYGSPHYAWRCYYALSLGTADAPIACNLGSCSLVKTEVKPLPAEPDPAITIDPCSFADCEVPVECC